MKRRWYTLVFVMMLWGCIIIFFCIQIQNVENGAGINILHWKYFSNTPSVVNRKYFHSRSRNREVELLQTGRSCPSNHGQLASISEPHRKEMTNGPNLKDKVVQLRTGYSNMGFGRGIYYKNFLLHSPITCGRYTCMYTVQQNVTADLVLFFLFSLKYDLPKRPPGQLWAFLNGEAQKSITQKTLDDFDGIFNYSLTYLRTSEFADGGYAFASKFYRKSNPTYIDFATVRRKSPYGVSSNVTALWMVSNCQTQPPFAVQSGRMEYAQKLSQFIKLDVQTRRSTCLNRLMNLSVPLNMADSPDYDQYWFYLAFENSLCRDYITEKFWKVITTAKSAIPIVMGGLDVSDYERIAPPNSFLHVKNFTSPEHLAHHLKHIVSDDNAFNYYHQWRNEYHLDVKNNTRGYDSLCYICRLAHERPKGLWDLFSAEHDPANCKDVSSAEQQCSYYNIC